MKISTKNDLQSFLDQDWIWRKREFSNISNLIDISREHLKKNLLRSGLVLLYAHWEGYIKRSAQAYLCYVQSVGGKLDLFSTNIIVTCLYKRIKNSQSIGKYSLLYKLIQDAIHPSFKFEGRLEDVIDTKSNLKYEIFSEILMMLSIDARKYELKKQLIDYSLVDVRNAICHGEYRDVDIDDFSRLKDTVIELGEAFRTDILNLVSQQSFLSS